MDAAHPCVSCPFSFSFRQASVKKIQFQAPSRIVVYTSDGGGGAAPEPLLFDVTGKGDLCFSGTNRSAVPLLPCHLAT